MTQLFLKMTNMKINEDTRRQPASFPFRDGSSLGRLSWQEMKHSSQDSFLEQDSRSHRNQDLQSRKYLSGPHGSTRRCSTREIIFQSCGSPTKTRGISIIKMQRILSSVSSNKVTVKNGPSTKFRSRQRTILYKKRHSKIP